MGKDDGIGVRVWADADTFAEGISRAHPYGFHTGIGMWCSRKGVGVMVEYHIEKLCGQGVDVHRAAFSGYWMIGIVVGEGCSR